jgi:hypothetical protein
MQRGGNSRKDPGIFGKIFVEEKKIKMLGGEEDLDSIDLRAHQDMRRSRGRNDEKTKSTAIDAFVSKLSATKLGDNYFLISLLCLCLLISSHLISGPYLLLKLGYYQDQYLPILLQSLHREIRKQPIINRGTDNSSLHPTLSCSLTSSVGST